MVVSEEIVEEIFELKIGRSKDTGHPRWLTVRHDGKLNSPPDDRPAKIVYDEQGRAKELAWFRDNLYHRQTGPALKRINPDNNVVTYEEHRWFGKMHRSHSEPALVERDPKTGKVTNALYFVDDNEVFPGRPSGLDLGL